MNKKSSKKSTPKKVTPRKVVGVGVLYKLVFEALLEHQPQDAAATRARKLVQDYRDEVEET